MKKFLLSLVTMLFGGFCVANAQEPATVPQMAFSYCGEDVNGIGSQSASHYVCGAMQVTAKDAARFAGSKLTGVRVGSGIIAKGDAVLFIMEKLSEGPVYTQQLTDLPQRGWTNVTLDTPYEITDKAFYVGYYTYTSSDRDFPIGFDGDIVNTQPCMGLIAFSPNSAAEMFSQLEPYAHQFGRFTMRLYLEGENLPMNLAEVRSINVAEAVNLTDNLEGSYTLRNSGANTITEVEVSYQMGEQEPVVKTIDGLNLENDKTISLGIEDVVCSTEGFSVPFNVTVNKINGEAMEEPANNEVTMMVGEDLPTRVVVVEEGTGTWCQYCPRGYVGMEYMKEKYGDTGSYIGIAVHNGDAMALTGYQAFLNTYLKSFPSAMVNRLEMIDPSVATLEESYLKMLTPVEATMTIEAEYTDETREALNANVFTNFCFDIEESNYGIIVEILEDQVGPYAQKNAYAGGANGPCGGFENQGFTVFLMYNDIPVYINNWQGAVASVPQNVKKNVLNKYTQKIKLTKVGNLNNARIVALLVDRNRDGQIVTGAELPLTALSSVKGVESGKYNVVAAESGINVTGEFDSAEIYGLNGIKVGALQQAGTINVAKGIYLVKVLSEGEVRTQKVAL